MFVHARFGGPAGLVVEMYFWISINRGRYLGCRFGSHVSTYRSFLNLVSE